MRARDTQRRGDHVCHRHRQRIGFCSSYDETRIAFAQHGQGPPLLKVGHWLTHVQEDWRSPIWRPRLEDIGDRFSFTRYDCRDTGLSDRDVDTVTLEAWVADLEAVADAAGLKRFALLGIGQGGPVAIRFARRHSDKVAALVLWGTYAVGRARRSAKQQAETEALATLISHSWSEQNAAIRQMWTTRMLPDGSQDQMRWLNELQCRAASAKAAVRSYRVCTQLDVSDDARALRTPTLVLHARGDGFIPFDSGRELAALIPESSFVPLASNNHLVLANEQSWTDFLGEVHGFLGAPSLRRGVLSELTAREHELVDLIASGLDNNTVAERCHVSPKTVRNHITHIFSKLGVRTRAEVIVLAREAGLGR